MVRFLIAFFIISFIIRIFLRRVLPLLVSYFITRNNPNKNSVSHSQKDLVEEADYEDITSKKEK